MGSKGIVRDRYGKKFVKIKMKGQMKKTLLVISY